MRSMKIILAGAVVAACLSGGLAQGKDISALQQTGNTFSEIAEKALPAVVFIDVESTVEVPVHGYSSPLDEFFRRQPYAVPRDQGTRKYHQQGQGSGFIISRDGYILTNNHVVQDAERIKVTLGDGRTFDAELVGTDPKTEVALIRVQDDDDFPYLELGDSDALKVGEWVLAAGNPFGLSQTITAGIVSAKERSEVGITEYANFIQTDAAINPGNSGGPLLNIHGEVIGINTAIYSQTGGYMGIGFAIPINQAIPIKDQLIEYGSVRRSVLGVYIQDVDEELAESFGLNESGGILISQVMDGSSADEAGLKSGDIVVQLGGEAVHKLGSFRSKVAAVPPGSTVALKVFRDGQYLDVTAITKAMEADMPDGAANLLGKVGIKLKDPDAQPGRREGVEIAEVFPDSPAWRAGLRAGQAILAVNRMAVDDKEEFVELLENAAKRGQVLLLVSEGRRARYVVVRIDP